MENEQIAYCGLVCSSCPTFLATQADDDEARKKTAAVYSKKFKFDLKPEDINCDGCKTEGGKRIAYCQSCAVRQCAGKKNMETCAECEDRPCEALTAFHAFSPDAKTSFETLLNKNA